jgi:hypothetical protein
MTVLYTNNFDTDTAGSIATGWTGLTGTWQVGTTNPSSGTQAFGDTAHVVGNLAQLTGLAARADSVIQCVQKLQSTGVGTTYHIAFRTNSGWTNGYQFALAFSGTLGALAFQFYRKSSGSYTKLNESTAVPKGFATNDMLNFEVNVVGTTFEFRVWKVGNSRPTSPDMSVTDSTYTTGQAGLYGGGSSLATVDDFVVLDSLSVATALTLTGPATGSTGSASASFTVAANGSLASNVAVSLSDGGAGGTFSPATVTLTSSAVSSTFTYTAVSDGAKTISITNDGGLSNPSSLTYTSSTAPTATAVTLTGPTSGATGAASTNFTVGVNGTIGTSVVVTPNDSSGGGTFTPTSVTLTSGSPSGTFTYSPASDGAHTVSVTNGSSLSNPSSITYTSTSVVVIPVTNTNVFFSPYNWFSNGAGSMQSNNVKASSTYAWSNNRGAYMRFVATVGASGSITLNVDTTSLASVANAAGCPNLAWSVGNGSEQTVLLAAGNTSVTLASGLSAGTYAVFLCFKSVYITQDGDVAGCYTAPNNRVQVTGITLSAGGTVSAPLLKSKRMVIYGDSITEGDRSMSGTRSAASQDAKRTYGWHLAEVLDAEVGIVGWYGQQWSFFSGSWSNQASGVSRLNGGLLLPSPDYVVINYGENDGNPGPTTAAVNPVLAAIAVAAPAATIVLNVPFSGKARTNLAQATLPAKAIRTDLARPEMAPGALQWSFVDGQHPSTEGHSNLGALLGFAIVGVLGSQGGGASTPTSGSISAGATVTVTLPAGGRCAIASNGGLFASAITPTGGTQKAFVSGPLTEHVVHGPYNLGASISITNQTCGSLVYAQI